LPRHRDNSGDNSTSRTFGLTSRRCCRSSKVRVPNSWVSGTIFELGSSKTLPETVRFHSGSSSLGHHAAGGRPRDTSRSTKAPDFMNTRKWPPLSMDTNPLPARRSNRRTRARDCRRGDVFSPRITNTGTMNLSNTYANRLQTLKSVSQAPAQDRRVVRRRALSRPPHRFSTTSPVSSCPLPTSA